jgi:hypothetical protein
MKREKMRVCIRLLKVYVKPTMYIHYGLSRDLGIVVY